MFSANSTIAKIIKLRSNMSNQITHSQDIKIESNLYRKNQKLSTRKHHRKCNTGKNHHCIFENAARKRLDLRAILCEDGAITLRFKYNKHRKNNLQLLYL